MRFNVRSGSFLATLLLLSTFAAANNVTVDCTVNNAPGQVSAAINGLQPVGPNMVAIRGVCPDNVNIFHFRDITLIGATPDAGITAANPNNQVLHVQASEIVNVYLLTLTGGRGAGFNQVQSVDFYGDIFQNSAGGGLSLTDSLGTIDSSTIQNNFRSGISIDGSTLEVGQAMRIQNNGRTGLVAQNKSKVRMDGGDFVTPGSENYIQNNGGNGIACAQSTAVENDGDTRVLNNGVSGIVGLHNCSFFMVAGTISGNANVGAHIGETSHGEFGDVVISNNGVASQAPGIEAVENSDVYIDGGVTLTGNGWAGIVVDWGSLLSSVGGNTVHGNAGGGIILHALSVAHFIGVDSVSGNGVADLSCDTTSLVSGDVSAFATNACKNIERPNGPPRGGLVHPTL